MHFHDLTLHLRRIRDAVQVPAPRAPRAVLDAVEEDEDDDDEEEEQRHTHGNEDALPCQVPAAERDVWEKENGRDGAYVV